MGLVHIPKAWNERRAGRTTPEGIYLQRREVLKALGLGTLALGSPQSLWASRDDDLTRPALGRRFADRFPVPRNEIYELGDDRTLTDELTASSHNNFYEFTVAKDKVWQLARDYPVDPWTLRVHGLVHEPRTFGLDDLFRGSFREALEERHYRFRCVERWSMQVPWTGFPLRKLLDVVKPMSKARWIRFISFEDRQGLPGQRKQTWYEWPYYEALRIDEAVHDLTLFTVGIYGHGLPMQHGAPWRIVAPWKYGFKSPKSLVEIEVVEGRPGTFWNDSEPEEYGFFSNVDPGQPHPRWTQRFETDIGSGATRETQPYNGYGDLVAHLYDGDEI
ncbi:MAG: protein-methionine-sulfoxide reductase catalytic subunit MsrP [Thermoanaerobaculia bacterium]|nr:protein-methionine-sulfoxide reductase catalytic subunit MsrP [Thermoanaerobaculia bacterium]